MKVEDNQADRRQAYVPSHGWAVKDCLPSRPPCPAPYSPSPPRGRERRPDQSTCSLGQASWWKDTCGNPLRIHPGKGRKSSWREERCCVPLSSLWVFLTLSQKAERQAHQRFTLQFFSCYKHLSVTSLCAWTADTLYTKNTSRTAHDLFVKTLPPCSDTNLLIYSSIRPNSPCWPPPAARVQQWSAGWLQPPGVRVQQGSDRLS